MTSQQDICPKCQATIPADAPGGLCPRCVMAGVSTTVDQPPPGTGDVPSLEQLRGTFPQLEIIELIGRGGMGFVFKARQLHLDREVALKLLPEKLGADPHFAERFTREARVLAKLNHPNIVMVHDFGHAGGFFYLVMEYIDGLNLRQAMRMGKFSPDEALAIVPKICDALQFAHEQGVLHRDIKPENILLDAGGRVKIADFGIAKLVGENPKGATLTGTGASLGTPHYMAPEQFENPAQVDHRADIYSLGVVFYEMLTGELPLGRFSAPSERTDLDERVDAIVLRALARERELRHKDARELQTEVEKVTSTAVTPKRQPTTSANLSLPRRIWFHRGKIATASGILFLALLAFANWKASRQWERLYWNASQGESVNAIRDAVPVQHNRFTGAHPSFTNHPAPSPAASSVFIDPAVVQQQNAAIEEARQRYATTKESHSNGEISDRDLAMANRDVMIAEARGDSQAIAKANYEFLAWDYQEMNRRGNYALEDLWKVEQEMNDAQHSLELARAGTNELQKALADLKHAERAWGFGQRHRKDRVERNGVVGNFLSPEQLKKLENDYFYAELNYKRLKQKADANK